MFDDLKQDVLKEWNIYIKVYVALVPAEDFRFSSGIGEISGFRDFYVLPPCFMGALISVQQFKKSGRTETIWRATRDPIRRERGPRIRWPGYGVILKLTIWFIGASVFPGPPGRRSYRRTRGQKRRGPREAEGRVFRFSLLRYLMASLGIAGGVA